MPVAAGAAVAAWLVAAGATVATAAAVGAVATAVVGGLLVGAAIGGATALVTGGNFVEGVLKGALIGGITAGAASYLSGAASAAGALAEAGATAAESAAVAGNMAITADAATAAAEIGAGVAPTAEVGADLGTTLATEGAGAAAPPPAPTPTPTPPAAPTQGLLGSVTPAETAETSLAKILAQSKLDMAAANKSALLQSTVASGLGGVAQSYGNVQAAKNTAEAARQAEIDRIARNQPGFLQRVTMKFKLPADWLEILPSYKPQTGLLQKGGTK